MTVPLVDAQVVLEQHSKSFALAQRLLPVDARRPTAIVYAWCRRADDSVDEAPKDTAANALLELERELEAIYSGAPQTDPLLGAFQEVVQRYGIPKRYPRELLEGMRMDLQAERYASLRELYAYCYRVAGTVGLMMCHVLGVSHTAALKHAVHLGMAMQLTNICRDVVEDWQRGRLYVPLSLLPDAFRHVEISGPFPRGYRTMFASAIQQLLLKADTLYASGDRGLDHLAPRSGWAIFAARLVYARIGRVLANRSYDVTLGRAFVSHAKKFWLALVALVVRSHKSLGAPAHQRLRQLPQLRYPADVLPL